MVVEKQVASRMSAELTSLQREGRMRVRADEPQELAVPKGRIYQWLG